MPPHQTTLPEMVEADQRAVRPKKEDVPDMFELASEHPESFGSSTLYEEESKIKDETNAGKQAN